MAPDTVIQLCASFYSDEAVNSAKTNLYELCGDSSDRQDRCITIGDPQEEEQSGGHCFFYDAKEWIVARNLCGQSSGQSTCCHIQ